MRLQHGRTERHTHRGGAFSVSACRERGRQSRDGDIILAEVDGNWTMKYFRKKGRTVTLEAANPEYSPIVPQMELRIAGVVTALVRKYHR